MIAPDETFNRHSASVADIALHFPNAIDILNKHKLDYCCNGKKLFEDACKANNLNADQIWQEVQSVNVGSQSHERFNSWNLSLLIDYIVANHHDYVKSSIPEIQGLLNKVCSAHGTEHAYLFNIQKDFNCLAEELLNHLPKEEDILFPAIKKLEQISLTSNSLRPYNDLKLPILTMEHEHEVAGGYIKSIRSLSNNYRAPIYACPSFQVLYKMLQEFDSDLMQHIHLENNILFPKAKALTFQSTTSWN